jgi:hypothetical protein
MYTTHDEYQQRVHLPAETPPHLIFYRPLTPTEACAIWALLSSTRISGEHQELHLAIRREANGQLTGWMTQTAERSVLPREVALAPPELSQ